MTMAFSNTACYSCEFDTCSTTRHPCYSCKRSGHNYRKDGEDLIPLRKLYDWYLSFGSNSLRSKLVKKRLLFVKTFPKKYPDGTRDLQKALEAEKQKIVDFVKSGESGLVLLEQRDNGFFVFDTKQKVFPILMDVHVTQDPFHKGHVGFAEKLFREVMSKSSFSAYTKPPSDANAVFISINGAGRASFFPDQMIIVYCLIEK